MRVEVPDVIIYANKEELHLIDMALGQQIQNCHQGLLYDMEAKYKELRDKIQEAWRP